MLAALLSALLLAQPLPADTIGSIDFYGHRTISEATLRAAVALQSGDTLPSSFDVVTQRLRAIPGVADAAVDRVCCNEQGRFMIYVGIREQGTSVLTFRAAPTGNARLDADIVALDTAFDHAIESAVRRGVAREDESQGYALAEDSALRAVQLRFVDIAASRFDQLAHVARTSGDAAERALAVQIAAYGTDRKAVAALLMHATGDPNETVRNNAVRALGVLANWAQSHPDSGVVITPDPFIDLLHSLIWTDRNKGAFALFAITEARDAQLLAELKRRALPELAEMARWTSFGHAFPAFMILARIAGVPDGEAFQTMQAGEKERIIAAAMK